MKQYGSHYTEEGSAGRSSTKLRMIDGRERFETLSQYFTSPLASRLVSSCAHALGVPYASDVACSRFEVPEVVRMRQRMFPTCCALPGRARVFAFAGVTAVPPNPWVRFG